MKNSIIPLKFNDHIQMIKLFNQNKNAGILVIEKQGVSIHQKDLLMQLIN